VFTKPSVAYTTGTEEAAESIIIASLPIDRDVLIAAYQATHEPDPETAWASALTDESIGHLGQLGALHGTDHFDETAYQAIVAHQITLRQLH
jgi:hypothetical protein